MSAFLERIGRLTPKQLLLLALEQQEKLDALQTNDNAPIAILSMACRYPGGADDPDAFWQLLDEGRDAIRPVPSDRWDADAYFDADPAAPGCIGVRNGGFLDTVSGFDASFFGIAQREACSMDPQQRLLLEVAWEALERANLPADRLYGRPVGVFVGLCNSDHFTRLLGRGDAAIDAYLASGNAPSVAAGRIAYCLGLQGPALAVDTACSSSLVALHLACRSLRSGESETAVVGGVNIMCAPQTSIALTKSHMLAPDGRCKTFDASADGFARGEGCGVLLLKRLDDALAERLPVLAVIRGTAINQDGRSAGLTVPNGPAQEAVIRAALADAGLAPDEIDYVEAHGTGTALGDPIEIRALAAALGRGRAPDRPLMVGSVKTNIGHLESAAGIAGVMKVVLALQHGRIPRHLHFRSPSPHIPWSEIPLRVTAAEEAWQPDVRRRRAGVSSFGFSGTNAHVILEEPPAAAVHADEREGCRCLPLSARSPGALTELASRAAARLASDPRVTLGAAARVAGAGRTHLSHRLAVATASLDEARTALAAAAEGRDHPALRRAAEPSPSVPDVVFLFSGQGSQYCGMGRELYEVSAAFRETIDACDAILGPDPAGLTLKSVLWEAAEALDETVWTQPALVALEIAAARMWQSYGIEPAAVIGHSLGEYAAACVAGVFSLAECLKLVAERGRLTDAISKAGRDRDGTVGAMAALFTSAAELEAGIRACGGNLAVAAVNAPDSVVASGEAAALERLIAYFAARGVEARRLQVSFAAHSPLVEPALDEMAAAAGRVAMRAPAIPVAWNRGGLSRARPDAAYWRGHLRDAVLFGDGIAALYREGYRTFLEVGPHPTLGALAQRSLEDPGIAWLSTMRRGRSDMAEVAASLAELYVRGASVTWSAVEAPAAPVPWPTYPFEHRSYWLAAQPDRVGAARRPARPGHVFVGARLSIATPVFETRLSPAVPAGLADHRVQGNVIAPAPLILAVASACAVDAFCLQEWRIEDFAFRAPLVLPDEGCTVQTQLQEAGRGAYTVTVSTPGIDAEAGWTLHARGRIVAAKARPAETIDLPALRLRLGPATAPKAFAERLTALGVEFGPAFRVLGEAAHQAGESLVVIRRPGAADGVSDPLFADVAMLDGACQALGFAAFSGGAAPGFSILAAIDKAWWQTHLPDGMLAHAVLRADTGRRGNRLVGDVTLLSPAGAVIGYLSGVALDGAASSETDGLCYEVAWRPAAVRTAAGPFLRAPSEQTVARAFGTLADRHGLGGYDEILPALDRIAAAAIASALRQLGFHDRLGRVFRTESEAESLGVVPRHRRLFGRLLAILAEDGVLSATADGGWIVASPLPQASSGAEFRPPSADRSAMQGERQLLTRCVGALGAVLRGEQDPVHLLFPGGSFAEARTIYVESPYARTYNGTLVAALGEIIASLPETSTLRVLEIGGGTGGTTRFVLDALPADRTAYTFTDVSPAFLEAARRDFADRTFLRTALLDMERSPVEQGFPPAQFDVVIAANVLHAVTDLSRAVGRAFDQLAAGGVMLLIEGVRPERWIDLTFGLTQGWWHFTDDALRADYPLIPTDAWRDLLAEAGFEDVTIVPGDGILPRSQSQQAIIVARKPVAARDVTVVGSGPVATRLTDALAARGDRAQRMDALPPGGVAGDLIHCGALSMGGLGFEASAEERDAAERLHLSVLADLQAFTRHPDAGRTWMVTEAAQPADGRMAAGGRWQAPLWGLGRVFGLEHPEHWGGLVDLPTADEGSDAAPLLLASLDAGDDEDQVAWRNGRRLVARLARVRAPMRPSDLDPEGTYLITGGFGGLGGEVAQWLADQGARHIVLAGRRPKPESEAIGLLEARGVEVLPRWIDVADEGQVAALVREFVQEGRPLRGVIHAAADLNTAPLAGLSEAATRAMLRPKVSGTAVVERLTRGDQRDFFAAFSSSTALLGAAGFAHYAAANAFLDATAASAPVSAGQVISINWGTWAVMRGTSDEIRQSYRLSGLEPLKSDEALDLLSRALAAGRRQLMVARIDWSRMKPLQELRRRRPFLAEIEEAALVATSVAGPKATGLAQQLDSASPGIRQEILIDFVRAAVVATLGDDGTQPGLDIGMFDLGLDSLMAVELKRRLEAGCGLPLPSTLTFNHPTIRAMAVFLDAALTPRTETPRSAAAVPAAHAGASSELAEREVGQLSDEDVTARLLARLEELE